MIKLSDSEERLLRIVKRGRVGKVALVEQFYGGRERPFYPHETVNALLRNLQRKLVARGEKIALRLGPSRGCKSRDVWIEKLS